MLHSELHVLCPELSVRRSELHVLFHAYNSLQMPALAGLMDRTRALDTSVGSIEQELTHRSLQLAKDNLGYVTCQFERSAGPSRRVGRA